MIEKVEIENPVEALLKEYFISGELSDLLNNAKEVKGIDYIDLVFLFFYFFLNFSCRFVKLLFYPWKDKLMTEN